MSTIRSAEGHELFEREPELAAISTALNEAADGHGRLVVIEAAAGLGKTRLIDAGLANGRESGMLTLRARGSELERDFAFGVVRQLLEPHVSADEGREMLFEGAAAFARPLFATPSYGPPMLTDPNYAALHGLYWLISNLSSTSPLAVAVDDVHWADRPSLRFLAFLVARLSDLPVALVVALRTTDPAADEPSLMTLTTTPEAVALHPPPLTAQAIEELVAAALDSRPHPAFVTACAKATGGNPFYLHALLRELSAQRIRPGSEQAAAVGSLGPRSVTRAVLMRLSTVSHDAQSLARAAAVLGDGSSLAEAAELARLPTESAPALADLLTQSAILRSSRPLEFFHPILREAIYADLGEQERSAQHARAARILTAGRAVPERIAAQLLGAEPSSDPWAVDVLREAARRAIATGACDVAARYLRRALSEPPPQALVPCVLLELGTSGAAIGESDAMPSLRAAFEHAAAPELRGRAAFELARALLYLNRSPEAVDLIERAIDELGDSNRDLRTRFEVLLMMHAYTTTDVARRVVERIGRKIHDAERSGNAPPELLAAVAMERAQSTGPADEAAQLAIRALEGGRLVQELSGESPALYLATGALTVCARGDIAEQHLDDAIAEARRRGSARGFAVASCFRGWTRFRIGNLPGAEADLRAFLELAPEFSLDIVYAFGLGTLIDVLVERGEPESAEALLNELEPDRCDPVSSLFQQLRASSARLHLEQGRPQAALEQALAITRWEDEGGRHDAWRHGRPLAARAYAALGDREQAVATAADAVRRARDFGAADYLGVALHAAGIVAERERSIALLEEAASALGRSPARLERARVLIELGSALRRANRRSDAREPLRTGLELARACGARALAVRAQDELYATGARPRKAIVSGLDALTASERRVAYMAAEGRSNAQIAQALFVSLKTVETHLGHAYRKLGVRSRFELFRVLPDRKDTRSGEDHSSIERA